MLVISLDGFGIFGPSRIQPRSFKTKILLLQDFDFRFAQTTSTGGLHVRPRLGREDLFRRGLRYS